MTHLGTRLLTYSTALGVASLAGAEIVDYARSMQWLDRGSAAVALYDFESAPLGPLPPGSVTDLGDFSISISNEDNFGTESKITDDGWVNGSREVQLQIRDPQDTHVKGTNTATLAFDEPITALAFEFVDPGDSLQGVQNRGPVRIRVGSGATFAFYGGGPADGEYSLTFDTPETTLTFYMPSDNRWASQVFAIDNLQYDVVPAPPSAAMIPLALLCKDWRRQRLAHP